MSKSMKERIQVVLNIYIHTSLATFVKLHVQSLYLLVEYTARLVQYLGHSLTNFRPLFSDPYVWFQCLHKLNNVAVSTLSV